MTRINLVSPRELTDKHLIAEYRELPRVFNLAYAAYLRNDERTVDNYTLGTGHVRFFYKRLKFLRDRFIDIVNEMHRRGWKPAYTDVPIEYDLMPDTWKQDFQPSVEDRMISLNRLRERHPGY